MCERGIIPFSAGRSFMPHSFFRIYALSPHATFFLRDSLLAQLSLLVRGKSKSRRPEIEWIAKIT